MRGRKRWIKAKNEIGKEAEEGGSAKAMIDRQTDKPNKQCCNILSVFNPRSIVTQKITNQLQKRTYELLLISP